MDARAAAIVLVVAMCAASVYGAFKAPRDARWPIRVGGFGYQTTMGRGTGLVMWPVLGTMVASLAWMGDGSFDGITVVGLLLMLWAQVATVRQLIRS
jgi:quinol-cytochrome oxidoreductase complex cytochrome b subunit